MLTEILERCDAIEECYEFMLAYAAQGLPNDETSPRVREFLRRAVSALDGLAESCRAAVKGSAFLAVLDRDAAATVRQVSAGEQTLSRRYHRGRPVGHPHRRVHDVSRAHDLLPSQSVSVR